MTRKLLVKMGAEIRIVGVMAGLFLGAFSASADLEVSATVQIHARAEFEAPLSPHGTWVEVGSYGRCWRPVGVAVEWRPYCYGEWVWTDCGWYWESDEPWGWACYHYGCWVYDSAYGWVWVPGVEWAPAWVSWRVGGGFVGWAPLPPQGFFFVHRPSAEAFVFVGSGHMLEPVRPSSVIVKSSVVFGKTSEIGGVTRETRSFSGSGSQRVMVNKGPGAEMVQRAAGKTIRAVSIRDAVQRTSGPREMKRGGMEPKPKGESHDFGGQSTREAAKAGRDDPHGPDRATPSSGGFWQSGGPGGGHGSGGGGHGHGKG